jgi:hypothetical protein
VPVTVNALDPVTARSIGVRADGALLARPDGVPVAVWASSTGADELPRATELTCNRAAEGRAVA